MPTPAEQPRFDQPVVDSRGLATQPWMNYWLKMALTTDQEGLLAQILEIQRQIDEINDRDTQAPFRLVGNQSITVQGIPVPGGVVVLSLEGDVDAPNKTNYYGSDANGAKGWYAVSDTIEGEAGQIDKTVDADGISTFSLSDVADSGTGVLLATTFDVKGRKTGSKSATITGTADQIVVTNGDASSGLPTISLAPDVLASLALADSAVQSIVAGTGITVDDTDPQNPIVSAPGSGFAPPPTDGFPYVGLNGAWEKTNDTGSRYFLIEYPLLTDQLGNQLTDQLGNLLMANSPLIPGGWPTTTITTFNASLQSMTLAQANALVNPQDFQMVAITDIAGGREPCWYDASVAGATKWRRFSDRSIAN